MASRSGTRASHNRTSAAVGAGGHSNGAWWENYCAAVENASTITWKEFVKEFCRYHIPSATMKRKADEFMVEMKQISIFSRQQQPSQLEMERKYLFEIVHGFRVSVQTT